MSTPRNCGTEFADDPYAYSKLELVNMAMEKGLIKSVTTGLTYTIDELCIMNGFKGGIFKPKEKHKKILDYEKALIKKAETSLKLERIIKPAEYKELEVSRECMIPKNPLIQLREHQKIVVDHMLNHRGLLAIHSTGTGKTLTAVAAMNCVLDAYPDINVYVVTPKSLKSNFKKEIKKFGLRLRGVDKDKGDRIKVMTYDRFVNRIVNNELDCSNSFIIIDEVHNLKAEFKIDPRGGKITGKRAFVVSKCVGAAKKVLLLSATPVMNNPSEIINYISMITSVPLEETIKSKEFLSEILPNEKLFNEYFCCKVSVNLKEKDADYPTRIDVPIVKFEMDNEFYKKYHDIELKNFDKLESGKFTSNAFQNAVRRASVALDGEDSPKVQWAINFIKNEVANKRKTVIFSQFKEFGLEALRKHLDNEGIKYGLITGDIPEDFRKRFVKKFNKNKIFVLLISKAGGEGLDLSQTRNVVLMESNWNDSIDEQIIGRAIRYMSHSDLLESERFVNIYRLWMVKPKKLFPTDFMTKAIDETLYLLSYDIKQKAIQQFLKRLETVSIENAGCSCKLVSERKDKNKREQGEKREQGDKDEQKEVENETEAVINPEFFKEIFSEEREEKEEAVEESKEEREPEHTYIAPGKTSLAIEDMRLTEKQYKKITGVMSDDEYKVYLDEYKQNLKSKRGFIMREGKKVKVIEKLYKPPEEIEIDEETKRELALLDSDSD